MRATEALIPFAKPITDLLEARARLDNMDPRKAAATLDEITRAIDAAAKRVATGQPPSSAVAEADRERQIDAFRAAGIITSYKTNLQEWSRFYSGYDPLFTWWTATISRARPCCCRPRSPRRGGCESGQVGFGRAGRAVGQLGKVRRRFGQSASPPSPPAPK